jgi:hypothetical protein
MTFPHADYIEPAADIVSQVVGTGHHVKCPETKMKLLPLMESVIIEPVSACFPARALVLERELLFEIDFLLFFCHGFLLI